MKIVVDITRAIIENAGIGRYTREITRHLLASDNQNAYTLLSTHFRNNQEKNQRIQEFIRPNVNIKRLKIPGSFKELAWGWHWDWYEKAFCEGDVLLAPSFFEVNLGFKIPQVVTIHDMATFLYPEQRGQEVSSRHNKRVKEVCKKAQRIIAISESTKRGLHRLLGIDAKKIQVIYPGRTGFPKGGLLPRALKPKHYILFVGTIEPRKNLKNLLKAYSLIPIALRDKYPLVIVGGKGWNTQKELQEIGKTEGVNWLGYMSDADLGALYKNAYIFAYPSLYEGFGLPVIEAQQFGVPVVTSNLSSLPEACGDGGVLVDPESPKGIAKAIEHLLKDKKLYSVLSKKALANAQRFSWEKAARETLAVLKSVK